MFHIISENKLLSLAVEPILIAALIFIFALFVFGQNEQTSQNTKPQTTPVVEEKAILQPVFTDYKNIKIGMMADEVKDNLGKAKLEDKDGFYYIFSDKESVQIVLDKNKQVRVISVTYSENNEKTPKYEDVFGQETAVVTKPDGSIYNLVRYPDAGIWVAYSTTVGENPTVTITIQKM